MSWRLSGTQAAVAGVLVACAIAGVAVARHRATRVPRAVESTLSVRIVQRDDMALPERKGVVRDVARVRAIVLALGVDDHPDGPCPADYAAAEIGLVLGGSDVYARRNVYVFGEDLASASVVSVTSAGCRVGPPADPAALRRELGAGIDGGLRERDPARDGGTVLP